MSKHWYYSFLQDNGHILMLWSKKTNLKEAIETLVSTSVFISEIQSFFNIDITEVYWEYSLMNQDEQELLSMFVKAKYNATIYVSKH